MKKVVGAGKRRSFFFSAPVWVLVATDVCAVLLSCVLGYSLRLLFAGYLPFFMYAETLPALMIFPALYGILRLYSGFLMHPAEELKRLSLATSVGFLLLSALFFLTKSADSFSRALFLGVWIVALVLVPLGRSLVRKRYCNRPWWKTPAILMGSPAAIKRLRAELRRIKILGFAPVAFLYPPENTARVAFGAASGQGNAVEQDTVQPRAFFEHLLTTDSDDEELFADLARQYPHAVVFMHMPSFAAEQQERLMETIAAHFREILALPDVRWMYCIPAQIVHIRGTFALVLRRNLADKRRLYIKRVLDLLCTCLFGVVGLPLLVVLALLIRFDSPGPIFFRQRRLGKNGTALNVYKFRTMVHNAEATLAQHLAQSPELAAEWATDHKLRDDPRVTRVGRFLRQTSLDELPQLINVLLGEMSLVGPRPIVPDEVEKYGDIYSSYSRVPPGITGLWQVSGRNDISYEERVAFDRYYIANWSVWLDIYILARTVPEILNRRGAY